MSSDDNLGEVDSVGDIFNNLTCPGNLNTLHFNAQSLMPRDNSAKFDET